MAHSGGMTLLDRAVQTGLVRSFPYDQRRYPMLAYFPRRAYDAGEIKWDRVVNSRAAAQLVDSEGNARMVARDGLAQSAASPAHVKEGISLTQKEISILRQPGTDVTDSQARIVTDAQQSLAARRNELFNQMCVEMLANGTFSAPSSAYGPAFTLTYGWTALTAPSTKWDNASATPIQDVQAAISEFTDNAGYAPNVAFFNPKLIHQKLMSITQWLDFVKASPTTADNVRRGSLEPTNLIGDIPVTWIPVVGQWRNYSDTLADRWPVNKITFAYLEGGAVGEWASESNAINDLDGTGPVAWSYEHEGGQKGAIDLYAYDNGIPIARDINSVQTWTVYTT